MYASSKEFGKQEWIQYKAPAGAVVVEDNTNGQIVAMASYPRFDNRWMGAIGGDKFDQLFGDEDRPGHREGRPRQVGPRQPRGARPVQHGLVDQAVRRLVGDAQRRDRAATTPYVDQGEYKLESIPEDVCATGVRCEFKNASNMRTNLSSAYGPSRWPMRWPSAATRSSIASARSSGRSTSTTPSSIRR